MRPYLVKRRSDLTLARVHFDPNEIRFTRYERRYLLTGTFSVSLTISMG
jgi:hypothetical protein